MIDKLVLKFGSSSTTGPLEFKTSPITVFVGPNYSGKSKLIRETQYHIENGVPHAEDVILDRLQFKTFTQQEAEKALEDIRLTGPEVYSVNGNRRIERLEKRLVCRRCKQRRQD